MPVTLTKSYDKIKALTKPIRIVQGSQGASKTYSILILLFEYCYNTPNTIATVITKSYPLLKDGVIADMQSIYRSIEWPFDRMFNKQDKNLTLPNGSIIQFRNLDNKDFHKGKGARRDYLFVNEANRLSWASVDQMITRTDKAVFIDFNPDREFFVHEHYLEAGRDDVDFIILTYKDNSEIPKGEKIEIERRVEASKKPDASSQLKEWVRIYAYGQLGTYSDRRILDYEWCDKIPDTAKKINSGMDFGVSPDPTILVDLYTEGNNLYCDERFCLNNLMPEKIAGAERQSIVDQMELIKYPKGQMIIADSSGRTSILDMRKHGYNVIAIKKYAGSVVDGLNKLRGYNILLTKRSINLKKGIENFFWKVDKNNKIVPEPDGHEPDGIAAIRYAVMTIR